MPVVFQAQQSRLANKAGKRLYYPQVKLTGNVDTDVVANEIAELSSLTSGDVKNVVDNLVIVIRRHLLASESVTLDGFGTFRLTLKTLNGGVENPEDVTANLSQPMVRFLPASTRKTDGTVATRSLLNGARYVRFDPADAEAGGTTPTPEPGGGGEAGGEDEDLFG